LISALDEGGAKRHASVALSQGKDTLPTLEEVGWAPSLVLTVVENFAFTGIRFSDRPARS